MVTLMSLRRPLCAVACLLTCASGFAQHWLQPLVDGGVNQILIWDDKACVQKAQQTCSNLKHNGRPDPAAFYAACLRAEVPHCNWSWFDLGQARTSISELTTKSDALDHALQHQAELLNEYIALVDALRKQAVALQNENATLQRANEAITKSLAELKSANNLK